MGGLGALAVAAMLLSVGWGGVSIRPDQVAGILLERTGIADSLSLEPGHSSQQSAVLWNIRLPRALMSALVGAALAAAGVALQSAFRNELAEPTLLGVSGAAVVGVVVAYVVGAAAIGRWTLPLFGSVGAAIAVAWLLRFSWRQAGPDRLALVLSGVALHLFLAGLATLLVSAVRRPGMPEPGFLSFGGLTGVLWRDLAVVAPVTVVVGVVLARRARAMNILLLGPATARSLGVAPGREQTLLAGLAAVATGTVVGYSGSVAFVGLVAPFLVRRLVGDDHRLLLPGALLTGTVLVTLGDALARNLIAPAELPLGTFMAVVGGPLFLWLTGRGRRVGRW